MVGCWENESEKVTWDVTDLLPFQIKWHQTIMATHTVDCIINPFKSKKDFYFAFKKQVRVTVKAVV